jgi:hypothetical protein
MSKPTVKPKHKTVPNPQPPVVFEGDMPPSTSRLLGRILPELAKRLGIDIDEEPQKQD